jgi:hypothetical protein
MRSNQPLPHGGVEVLVDLITHQDLVTWTAVSIFLAAEVILVGFLLSALTSNSTLIGIISSMGLLITLASYVVVRRSNAYMVAYSQVVRERCHPEDLQIFTVRPSSLIPAGWALMLLHVAFFLVWGAITLVYIEATYIRPMVQR